MTRLFLLSPANCGGSRGRLLFSDRASFDLVLRLRSREGATLGEVFTFVSGLYFRGKLTYARAFARPADPASPIAGSGIFVITPSAGLRSPETRVTLEALQRFAGVDVASDNPRYRRPLERSARAIAGEVGPACQVVLLGSIASAKYVDVLLEVFGNNLVFPAEFVGRGDMSRGGLLLRCAHAGQELTYVPVAGAVRHGARPPRLDPATRVPRESRMRAEQN
ncbi:MAG TPA: hypothetical protein VD833_24575 [Vicinamibacterales bacterium]|nr:hypothetical protein [Vicinamibacterales bacterium]